MAIPENPKSAAAAAFKVENRLRTAPRIRVNLSHRKYFSSVDNRVPPECQADGCTADLSAAKHYYRRHKVCEFHSRPPPSSFPEDSHKDSANNVAESNNTTDFRTSLCSTMQSGVVEKV
ncbi:hypothetical protein HPP92_010536 [Vanilla planifolia]|uniref:SBP-type domain-containing protein n=1 Tax=Vanilla planifolia TaxID=51239 RepID=A0A835V1X5_VANPL|nr:hypothetical protein HPP92_010536 [Vanilla planifolia]